MSAENTFLFLLRVDVEDTGEYYIYCPSSPTKGKEIKASGAQCRILQPDIDLDGEETKFKYDKSLMMDIGMAIKNVERQSLTPDIHSRKCFICSRKVDINNMRAHVGKHILDGGM